MVDNLLMKEKVRNYNEYLKISPEKSDFIKPTFVFIEEFSVLLNSIEDTIKKESIIVIVRHIALS
jgi:hypothetical protein